MNIFNRKTFRLFFIIYVYINTLALGYLGIDINPLCYPIFIWAILLIGHDLYHHQIDFHDKSFIIILSYGLILLLATLINDYSQPKSYVIALMQLIIFILIFGNSKEFTKDNLKKELATIIPLTNILVFFSGTISLIMYLFKYTSSQNGWLIGMANDRLFGIYFNCNPAAFLSAIVILLAILAIHQGYRYKGFYGLNIIIQLIYIVLTKCRASIIILAMIITVIIYSYCFKPKNYSRLKKYFFSFLTCGVILLASVLTRNGLAQLTGNYQNDKTSRFQIDKIIDASKLMLVGDFQPGIDLINQVSSGRIELLNTALSLWSVDPILGIGAGNFQTMAVKETESTVVKQIQVVHSHNVFVEALVTTGIIGATLFIIFFVKMFKLIFRLFKHYQNKITYLVIMLFALIVSSEFIGGLFDYGVFYVYSLSATLAWLFLGYLNFLAKDIK